MTLNVSTRTATDVANTVKRQFGDESGVQITDPDIIRWINDGQREINQQNKVLSAKATASAVQNQADYSLPLADAAAIVSIHYNGVPVRSMPYVEVEEYIKNNVGTNDAKGSPVIWYSWAGVITFWPAPVSSTDTITVLYVQNPPVITALSDTLGLPDRYFNALVQYVLSQAYEMDEDWDAANYKSQQTSKSLDDLADAERNTSEMTYPTISTVVDY